MGVENHTKREIMGFANPTQGERREEYLALHEAIAVLPKKQRLVIVLCYFKDYSIKDAAQILHIPEGTVKSRMAAAKATLKRRLQND